MKTLSKDIYQQYKQYPEKILQFGEGNFLRAFVDWQIEVLNKKTSFNGSVVIVQPRGSEKIHRLNKQNGLYTLYQQGVKDGKEVNEHNVINSISRGIDIFANYEDYIDLAGKEELRFIVSNTTEAGIAFDPSDRLEDRPQKSFPGKLSAFLYYRFKKFNGDTSKGCIIIPCELIEENGKRLKEIVLQYADLWEVESEFVDWIHQANTFCCSLVDRIVPGFPKNSIDEITKELGYMDQLVVVGEQYHLWVIQGPKWIKNELPVEGAGLNTFFVDDLTPYRTRKVKILNGAHTSMAAVSYLYGLNTVGETVNHEIVGTFIKELIEEEIIPTIAMSSEELTLYAAEVLDRFRNPYIHHYLMSIALNGVSKFKTRNLPSLLEYVDVKGKLPTKLVFTLSALIAFYKGKRGEEEINLEDHPVVLSVLKDRWENCDGTREGYSQLSFSVLGDEELWGTDLNLIAGLTDTVADYLERIEKNGMKAALDGLSTSLIK
ncbi:tagaturonate reductase [Jeotgalibacillus soli]|uniref:Altronate oxidoreductase n=1 Tax=Jeotgalibacillus soli TaxID=889306 RepID=A0A0C2W7Y7_9BACL|nr:tagaturonate reductase [Jeotgalibacillus soli]KIL52138.1 altronate oxidoreductase [Jeotgalibacillus soli]